MIDRLEAMRVFVTALDEGSLACAGRRLSRSPAAMTRAIAALERHVGARLLHRTTRVLQLTEAGEQYAAVCRRVLTDLDEADLALAGNRAAPRGVLTVTAPVMFGTRVLRPVVGEFLRAYPAMQVRYLLLNRVTNLVDEGIDVALRIAPLQESSLIAVRIGEVRRVLCASPRYLADRPPINTLADLARHDCIGIEPTSPTDIWSFPPARGSRIARTVRVKPRLMVNTDDAAVGAAIDGEGIVRIFSYKIQDEVRDGRLAVLLPADEPPPVPIHLVVSPDRLALAKVRAFMDFAAGRLRTPRDRMVPQVQTSDAAWPIAAGQFGLPRKKGPPRDMASRPVEGAVMHRKRHTAKEVVAQPRQVDVGGRKDAGMSQYLKLPETPILGNLFGRWPNMPSGSAIQRSVKRTKFF